MAPLPSYQELLGKISELESELESVKRHLRLAESQLTHDALTGGLNTKGFLEHLSRLVANLNRHQEDSLYIAYADINSFKSINDRFGHSEGDRALIHLASVLKQSIREVDIVARLHGDEFALAFPSTTKEGAAIVLNRITEAIASSPFPTTGQDIQLGITIVTIPYDPSKSPEDNLIAADKAMLAQKPSSTLR